MLIILCIFFSICTGSLGREPEEPRDQSSEAEEPRDQPREAEELREPEELRDQPRALPREPKGK